MKYVLDTGILTSIERKNKLVIKQLDAAIKGTDTLQITILNYAEFYYGYAGKSSIEKHDAEAFLDTFEHLTVDKESAKLYAELG
jgi:predicted nucleic acid-binding protein